LAPCDHDPDGYAGAPKMTGFSPTHGEPGTTVTIYGSGFYRLDERYDVAYGDFSQGCEYATLAGTVVSDGELEVTIPKDATLSGYVYLVGEGLTVARAPNRFTLDVDPVGIVNVQNVSQFPVVTVEINWEDALEAGTRIDIEDAQSFTAPAGPMHVRVCVGGPNSSGTNEEWACNVWEGRLAENGSFLALIEPLPAARFLEGTWEASWVVDEDTYVEELRINQDGYWTLHHGGRVVESGNLLELAWPAYSTDFKVGIRADEALLQLQVPVNSFELYSPRASGYLTFRRPDD